MNDDAAELARYTARSKHKDRYIMEINKDAKKDAKWVDVTDRYNALEEQYGEPTRKPILYGWDRWMTAMEGPAVDDLAGRSYTLMELHDAVSDWLFCLDYDDLKDDFNLHYSMIRDISYDFDTLTELYKKLWELRETRPELKHTKPYWKEDN
jgi:hypothetical protein